MAFDQTSLKILQPYLDKALQDLEAKKRLPRISPEFLKAYEELTACYRKLKAIPKSLKGPVFVGMDPTYRCNFSCPYCYLKAPLCVKELSTEEWINVFKELNSLNVLIVCFSGGEPTLRKDLLVLIERAAKYFVAVNMVTNGLLVDDEFSQALREVKVNSVQVSLDGASSNVMDTLRGKGTFKKAINAIQNLIRNQISVHIGFASTKHNILDFPNVVRLASELQVTSVRTMYLVPEHSGSTLVPSDNDYLELLNWIRNNSLKYSLRMDFGDPMEHIKIGKLLPTLSINITPEGFILPTPYIPIAYGNVKEGIRNLWQNGLSNIWQHPVFVALSTYMKSEFDIPKLKTALGIDHKHTINIKELSENQIKQLVDKICLTLS
ncbi:MAG: pyrroloquinoline quinone biosynthesis protein PqqE [Candidatus Bathyarchaeota archaeon BA2]|nr:MAG: pyrroloquinoline quinone biosynthesis protein PqqE [Candidatus Bathyarchaeota archaeon BA2]